ncbi:MAG: neuraminidase-like domain-containing protein [Candidatus Aquirickettsiella sp.]
MEKDFTYTVQSILAKLVKKSKEKTKGLDHFMPLSFEALKQETKNILSRGEMRVLYKAAQQGRKDSTLLESRLLAHANPQLARAMRLGVMPLAQTRSYDEWFDKRARRFVKPGAVASMFSPAAYLTELYREAKDLYEDTSSYCLAERRPDLASLTLTQENMDAEISTLTLSNELLLNNIQTQEGKGYDEVMEMLSTYRQTGITPYHLPYEAARYAILLQDKDFSAFTDNPDVMKLIDPASLLAIQADISPGLYQILIEDITEKNAPELVKKNFGEINIAAFCNYSNLAHYYDLSYEELSSQFNLLSKDKADSLLTKGIADTAQQQYTNDQLMALIKDDTGTTAFMIKRTPGGNYSQVNYVELIPQGGDSYLYNFSLASGPTKAMQLEIDVVDGKPIYLFETKDLGYELNEKVSIPVTLTRQQLAGGITLGMTRYGVNDFTGSYHYNTAFFLIYVLHLDSFLLNLNKLIRLYKATGLDVADIGQLIQSVHPNDVIIDSAVLDKLFYVKYYLQRYPISVSDALVLSNADIGQYTVQQQASLFTRLFNTPFLNGQEFSADNTDLDLTPGVSDDDFRLGVLKRAFQVNDIELYTLWKLACGAENTAFTCSVKKLSVLYRLRLLAEWHHLTVHELSLLLSIASYAGQNLANFSDAEWASLVNFLYQCTQWLAAQQWTVSDVFLMLTSNYSTTLTPDIENLITTLRNGVSDTSLSGETLMSAAAPFIAAATQLDSAETATAILRWINQLKPQGLSFDDFMQLVTQTTRADEDTQNLVAFCQVLGQLSLMVRNTGLSASELSLLVTQPEQFQKGATLLTHDFATLQALTRFHTWITHCGSYATEVLTALGLGTLTTEQLALALTLDAQEIAQALQHTRSASTTVFSDWKTVDVTLQWLAAAAKLSITPDGVAALIKLKYIAEPNTATPSFSDWRAVSSLLQAGLNSQQTADLQAALDEASSAAVSAYYIKNVAPSWVASRDELYNYLLIDNQVSAQIKTTRLAEAIASIQLYVNRALSGVEIGAVEIVRTHPFFNDWETYNKRYSTWAGVSLLVYYPENYIDPTLRIGQTKMMDDLLQQISQSQLSTDTVEEGFRNYLAVFEEVANLNVTGGYHDNLDVDEGFTYFMGYSQTEPKRYYWRKLDHSKAQVGRFAANAWGEWNEIVCAMVPYQGFIRPVLYKSRLYVVWIEQERRKSEDASTDTVYYHFKLSHLRYDRSWESPFTFDITAYIKEVDDNTLNETTGLFSAEYGSENTLIIFFYKKQNTYADVSKVKASGFYVFSDITIKEINSARLKSFIELAYNQLDTLSLHKINSPISEFKKVDFTQCEQNENDFFTLEAGVGEVNYSITSAGVLNIDFSPELKIRHKASTTDAERLLCQAAEDEYGVYTFLIYEGQVPKFHNVNIYDVRFIGINISNASKDSKGDYKDSKGDYAFLFVVYSQKAINEDELSLVIEFEQYEPLINVLFPIKPFNGEMTIYVTFPGLVSGYNGDPRLLKKMSLSILSENEDEGTELVASIDINNANNYKEYSLIHAESVYFDVVQQDGRDEEMNAKEDCSKGPEFNDNSETYRFDQIRVTLSDSWISASTVVIECIFAVFFAVSRDSQGIFAINELKITISKNDIGPALTLNTNDNRAQYMQSGPYRTRLNTLFATQLIARANLGIDTVLTRDTQTLPEPAMGDGGYVRVTLAPYDSSEHGNSRYVKITLWRGLESEGEEGYYDFWEGTLTDSPQPVILFVPLSAEESPFYNIINFPYSVSSGLKMYLSSDKGRKLIGTLQTEIANQHIILTGYTAASNPAADVALLRSSYEEPMDFSGANALYFWEMFYYTPMLVFQRLLQEQSFAEATRWLHYIWNPVGYLVQGERQDYYWNVRPLAEDTSWNVNPFDVVDPDTVAQNDPMHYKVATFMRALDLLIARGDAAYRQLERDTLNEAKMWYMQAFMLLGDESYIAQDIFWSEPRLDAAAELTTRNSYQRALFQLSEQVELPAPATRTANSLTALFLPQLNEKLQGYWQTLAQRLYNLRHNLSIDGYPLSLPIYATPANPSALRSAAVSASQGGGNLPQAVMPLCRFPVILENAKGAVAQLTQFGNTLLSITERQDAEALTELLQAQGSELTLQSIQMQEQVIAEIDTDQAALQEGLNSAQSRFNSFKALYDENVNRGEKEAMDLYLSSSVISTSGKSLYMAAAAADLVPNIYGLAVGGTRFGALFNATGIGVEITSSATRTAADKISQSEAYRRRRQEWESQRNNVEFEIKQLEAQLGTLEIRRAAALLQKVYLETQQTQTQAQLAILQNKFSNKALYNWLRGRLAAIYYQVYDLTVSRCLMAEQAYQYELNDNTASFIKPGAWQGTYAGLLAGETLMLNLVQMEKSYLEKDARALEVTRTVSLAEVYAGLDEADKFIFSSQVQALIEVGSGSAGTDSNGLSIAEKQLVASVQLADLKIRDDYPVGLGDVRRIKQISVTLPALLGPYQDVQAVLSYGGSAVMPRGCKVLAVSHGINDSGQFVLDFNDAKYLPFEGIPVDDNSILSLSFPHATGKQAEMLKSLNDIILHIRYTIHS